MLSERGPCLRLTSQLPQVYRRVAAHVGPAGCVWARLGRAAAPVDTGRQALASRQDSGPPLLQDSTGHCCFCPVNPPALARSEVSSFSRAEEEDCRPGQAFHSSGCRLLYGVNVSGARAAPCSAMLRPARLVPGRLAGPPAPRLNKDLVLVLRTARFASFGAVCVVGPLGPPRARPEPARAES